MAMVMKTEVVVVGAGPSGLATSACLNLLSIPNIVIEREDCSASLWKKRAYDRLNLHLAKEFCELPHMTYPPNSPTFIPKKDFIQYLDDYVAHFKVKPRFCRSVQSATFDTNVGGWVRNSTSNEFEEYSARFLVVATGENGSGFIPNVPGLDTFGGEIVHSSMYKSGQEYNGKAVLVVGCGNSGMEIAYDLSNYGAMTSIVVRSPGVGALGNGPFEISALLIGGPFGSHAQQMEVRRHVQVWDLKAQQRAFYLKATTGRSAVIDVGTMRKIESGVIEVVPALVSMRGNEAAFANGKLQHLDAVIFATGYRSTAKEWFKDDDYLLNNDGLPKPSFPNHWKGRNGLYCAGLSRRGLAGVSMDAQNIANDIHMVYTGNQ